MQVPEGYTEAQVLEIISKVVTRLAPSLKFAFYDVDDIKQEGTILALEVLAAGKYDPSRPLENFLYVHIKRRLFNLRRNKFARHEPPCLQCPFFQPDNVGQECGAFRDKLECDKYATWLSRNSAKKNLNQPIELSDVDDEKEDAMHNNMTPELLSEHKEMMVQINKKLDVSLRSDFLKLTSGVKLPKSRKDQIYAAIKEILDG
jgi:hypothetical protein